MNIIRHYGLPYMPRRRARDEQPIGLLGTIIIGTVLLMIPGGFVLIAYLLVMAIMGVQ